jgi:pimeloyl-ACP methyl ester carboxylesterase
LSASLDMGREPSYFRFAAQVTAAIVLLRPFLHCQHSILGFARQRKIKQRYDKRGIGRSTGIFRQATLNDFADDAQASVEYLKTRKEVDPAHIGLIGHSEGGSVGPTVAIRSKDVAFLVLMAGMGISFEETLKLQRTLISKASGIPDSVIARNEALSEQMIAIAKTEKDLPTARKRLGATLEAFIAKLSPDERQQATANAAAVKAQIEMLLTPWFRSALAYDPVGTFKQVTCPVLALNGSKDLEVAPKENLAGIEAGLKAGGNRDVTIQELPGLNHLFQTADTGNVSEYGLIEETMSPTALKRIGDWIQKHAGAK